MNEYETMMVKDINVNKTIERVKTLLKGENNLSPALSAAIEMLLLVVTLLSNRLGLNSSNSSKPPSSDINRKRGSKKKKSGKRPGGQNGHVGSRLEKTDTPDEIEHIKIDKRTLPRARYHDVGYEARQVIDIKISRVVTEYRAQILESATGEQYIAPFPAHVPSDVQYGPELKAHSVYMSQFQLLPYGRIQDYFAERMDTALSGGSIFNFNKEAYQLLEAFDEIAKNKLIASPVVHSDETGINVNKKRMWLHSASSELWTYFYPHIKRGTEAMNDIGILPHFGGTLCHDHWKPYYKYTCTHSLCNAHHLRELEWSYEQDKQQWADRLRKLLLEVNDKVNETTRGALSKKVSMAYRKEYTAILSKGEKECPLPTASKAPPKRGRIKKSKSRNLLERLRDYEDDTLRFMEDPNVPFTNNRGENDLRMTKVQQKISGCFRSMDGAYMFCRIRSYLSTCRKHGVKITEALQLLFQGKMPDFIGEYEPP